MALIHTIFHHKFRSNLETKYYEAKTQFYFYTIDHMLDAKQYDKAKSEIGCVRADLLIFYVDQKRLPAVLFWFLAAHLSLLPACQDLPQHQFA